MEYCLSLSDIIEICGISASIITSIVAIAISVKTLKQNSKMLEESTRPQIQIYPVHADGIVYIIIKNFGCSEAVIDSISCSHHFTKDETLGDDLGSNIFDKTQGALMCPGYSIKCPLVSHEVSYTLFEFKIKYHSSVKSYEATFKFTPYSNSPFADMGTVMPPNLKSGVSNIANEIHNIFKSGL